MPSSALLVAISLLPTAAPAEGPDFGRDVYPILKRHCFECHSAQKVEGELRLDDRGAFLAGGASGSSVKAGEPDESELLRRLLLPTGDAEHMPASGVTLDEKEIALLRAWIANGAVWPEDFSAGTHWAYVAPTRPAAPAVIDAAWPRNDLDRFVLARLEAEGLSPSEEADRHVLLRRVTLDLTGLPPTPAELDAFLADGSPDAYDRAVDRLLASPSFGEKWARPWLDLARYADSHGFQKDDFRSLWPYRDWVIRALNANMPYDEFTIEQIAGDLLPEPTTDQLVATGFHRCTTTNIEAGTEPEETRVNQILDRINTTATVWLGTTLECAQCHDHKYDPFTQKDYYGLFAYFNGTELEADRRNPNVPGSIRFLGPTMALPGDPGMDERRDGMAESIAKLDQRLETLKKSGGDESAVKRLTDRRAKLAKQLSEIKPPSTLVMKELPAARQTSIFERGVYTSPGEAVAAATPAVLPRADGPPNRLTLARWLVSRDNPLAARTAVNRWWLELFGRGLVTTPEDFGLKGAPPTHPELLDWLAMELIGDFGLRNADSNSRNPQAWDVKRFLRTIVISATYRQSSHVSSDLLERDPENTLYARGPRFRLDAEAVRDQALAVAGLLSRKPYGPPIRPWQPEGLWEKVGGVAEDKKYVVSPGEDAYRRGVYVVLKRGSPYPSFTAFDGTARLACTVGRDRSNTPLQALVLLNDPVYVEAAQALALRIVTEAAGFDDRLLHAVRLTLAREPSEKELSVLCSLYDEQYAAASAAPDRAKTLTEPTPVPEGVAPAELASWYAVATALLNLDEAITKE